MRFITNQRDGQLAVPNNDTDGNFPRGASPTETVTPRRF
jgi:hypothetical protein